MLELQMQQFDGDHVDAYYGPTAIVEQVDNINQVNPASLASILEQTIALQQQIAIANLGSVARKKALLERIKALTFRIQYLQGSTATFEVEAQHLFGVKPPPFATSQFETIINNIDNLLAGDGSIIERVLQFESQFIIPKDKLKQVFDIAIAECRQRTKQYINLPENENFQLEFVTNKSWSGYNWYQGNYQSLIQINTDMPIYIDRAVDLGCHEGYPGHHTYNVLLEKSFVNDKQWIEFALYPLFSPQSLIAEGTANFGIELAFPNNERIEFEKKYIFPIVSIDPNLASKYYQFLALKKQLNYASNAVARRYLNGTITRNEGAALLVKWGLSSEKRAMQRMRFIDKYRSYVINYNVGLDLVRDYMGRKPFNRAERWQQFELLLLSNKSGQDLELEKSQ